MDLCFFEKADDRFKAKTTPVKLAKLVLKLFIVKLNLARAFFNICNFTISYKVGVPMSAGP